jgi:ribosomal-protein-alanine N-acetyltransferase
MRLLTARLSLVACPAGFVEALERDRAGAGRLVGAVVPDGWPDPELAELLPRYAAGLRDDPSLLGFGIWLAVERAGHALVGSAGFMGRPAEDGSVKLGYGVQPAHRGQGYATESARALVDWALGQEGVRLVVADCERDNAPSIRVLEQVGMRRTGKRGTLVTWATPRAETPGGPAAGRGSSGGGSCAAPS